MKRLPQTLYVLQTIDAPRIAKIGVSIRPWDRMRVVEKAIGRKMQICAVFLAENREEAFAAEMLIKRRLRSICVYGTEMFACTGARLIRMVNDLLVYRSAPSRELIKIMAHRRAIYPSIDAEYRRGKIVVSPKTLAKIEAVVSATYRP